MGGKSLKVAPIPPTAYRFAPLEDGSSLKKPRKDPPPPKALMLNRRKGSRVTAAFFPKERIEIDLPMLKGSAPLLMGERLCPNSPED